jgi:Zn-dependent protease
VHAMRRCGLPVRGIYFIPLLGAAAVSVGMWRTRGQQAYIALNGPLWGLYLTLPVAAAAILFGRAHPVLPALAAWWSLINLFNLLPVSPLDGGRLLTALSHSIHSRLGIVLSGAMFAAALALAYVLEIGLLVVVGLFGLMELVAELRAGRAMSRLRAAAIDPAVAPESLLALRLLVRPAFRDEDEERLRSLELGRIARMLAPARVEPMGRGPTVLWGLLYVSLVAAFVVVILLASSSPAGGLALDVLR